MWPNRNVREEVPPTTNVTEEIPNMQSSSSASISPPVRLNEEDTQMSTNASTSLTAEQSSVNEVALTTQPSTIAETETNRSLNLDNIPLPPVRSRSPIMLRRAAFWRRAMRIPPIRASRSSSRERQNRDDNFHNHDLTDSDSDSDEDLDLLEPIYYKRPADRIDLLLRKSFHSHAAVQRPTAVRQLRCECSETVAFRKPNGPPKSEIWPRRRHPRLSKARATYASRKNVVDDDDDDDDDDYDEDDEEDDEDDDDDDAESNDDDESNDDNSNDNDKNDDDDDDDDDLSDEDDDTSSDDSGGSSTFEDLDVNRTVTVPFSHRRIPPPGPLPLRRHIRSIPNMPEPNLRANQVANKVIKYAQFTRREYEEIMCCRSCGLYPIHPISGTCGHTRCTECIELKQECPCGKNSPQPNRVNIVIRDMMEKSAKFRNSRVHLGLSLANRRKGVPVSSLSKSARASYVGPIRAKRAKRSLQTTTDQFRHHIPMSARARFAHALELLRSGHYKDAAPQLAIAAATWDPHLQIARSILAQVIMVLSKNHDPRRLTRELNHRVRHQTSMSWVSTRDMECILCCEVLIKPVTTPCGHMFCRTCLEKTLDYRRRCPLCLRSLGEFKISESEDTLFVHAALASINALKMPLSMNEKDLVPIFVCTVAYPTIPCPLFIFDPRYWLMIRRVLESGSRRFGMLAVDGQKKYADYGTILEVHDCVQLEDGRSILSTMGTTRFKVIERCIRDGCEVARIEPVVDKHLRNEDEALEIRRQASKLLTKARAWIEQLHEVVVADIESTFGDVPVYRTDRSAWWNKPDGPEWLWWLVAILPLRAEIKVLILSTNSLLKRLQAVDRTLEALEEIRIATLAPSHFDPKDESDEDNQ